VTRRILCALLLACGAFALTDTGVRAQPALPSPGDKLAGHLVLAGATVLLPPGAWVVGGISREPSSAIDGNALLSVALLQVDMQGVSSVVLAQRNADLLSRRPELSAECDARTAQFTNTPADDAAGGVCAAVVITRATTQPDTARAWRAAAGYAAEQRWPLPAALMVAAFRVVDRNSLLDVRYATSLSGSANAGTCSAIIASLDDPAIRRRVTALQRFTAELLPVIDLARSHDLDGIDAAPALVAPEQTGPSLLTRVRLGRIDAMQNSGTLTKAEADSLRATIAAQDTSDPLAAEILRRSTWKSGTARVATATGALAFWTYAAGDPLFALGMVALQSALIVPINDAIELGWTSIGASLPFTTHAFALPSFGTPCRRQAE
jgi:hypothetical protein